jgi:uncharacterized membrane protein (DUF485 family)
MALKLGKTSVIIKHLLLDSTILLSMHKVVISYCLNGIYIYIAKQFKLVNSNLQHKIA